MKRKLTRKELAQRGVEYRFAYTKGFEDGFKKGFEAMPVKEFTQTIMMLGAPQTVKKIMDWAEKEVGKPNIHTVLARVRARNPYPPDIFIEKSTDEWNAFHKALKMAGLKADGFMGSHSRMVWINALSAVEKELEELK